MNSTKNETEQAIDTTAQQKHHVNTKIAEKKPETNPSVGIRTRTGWKVKKQDIAVDINCCY